MYNNILLRIIFHNITRTCDAVLRSVADPGEGGGGMLPRSQSKDGVDLMKFFGA